MSFDLNVDKYVYDFLHEYVSPYMCGVKPDYISITRIIPMLFIFKAISDKNSIMLFLAMTVSVFMDVLDGSVARECKTTSKFGSKVDLFMDTVHHILIYY